MTSNVRLFPVGEYLGETDKGEIFIRTPQGEEGYDPKLNELLTLLLSGPNLAQWQEAAEAEGIDPQAAYDYLNEEEVLLVDDGTLENFESVTLVSEFKRLSGDENTTKIISPNDIEVEIKTLTVMFAAASAEDVSFRETVEALAQEASVEATDVLGAVVDDLPKLMASGASWLRWIE